MSPTRIVSGAFSALVVLATLAKGTPVAAGASPVVAASALPPDEDLNNRGVELRRAGRDQEALSVFRQAYDMTHSPRATAQLGIVYQALGRWELAAPLVEKGLQSPDDPWIKKYLTPLKEALDVIKAHVARIDVTGEPAGAEVIVNGNAVGFLPLPGPLTVVMGTVDVQVRAAGFRDDARKLTLGAYQHERIFVRLDKAGAAGAAPMGSPDAITTTEHSRPAKVGGESTSDQPILSRATIKWTALGLAVAGLGTGIAASFIHEQKLAAFENADSGNCRDMNGKAVDVNTGQPVATCQSLLDSYQTARTWQIVGFTAGGTLAVVWLVLQLTESPPARTAPVAGWSCAPSLERTGAMCTMQF